MTSNSTLPSLTKTLYEEDYKHKEKSNGQVYHYKTFPSLAQKTDNGQNSTSQYNFIVQRLQEPNGPHRKVDDSLFDGNITTSKCINFHVEKPIVRSPRPQHFNQWIAKFKPNSEENCKLDLLQKLEHQRKWTTTARFAMEESALPTQRYSIPQSTLESSADPVSCQLNKNRDSAPMLCQYFGRKWDATQLRKSISSLSKQKKNLILPKLSKCVTTKDGHHYKEETLLKDDCNNQPTDTSQFLKPIPGYGGYVPRHPILVSQLTDEQCLNTNMCTTARLSYRKFPCLEYRKLLFCHNGPLSKTITLTYPNNPFNNVQKPATLHSWH